jgi:PilZ domain
MLDRRVHPRNRVLYGSSVIANGKNQGVDCVVRNISKSGANIELPSLATISDDIHVIIPRIGKSLLAKIVWWRADRAGIAFQLNDDQPPPSLDERLRISEQKARALKQRVRHLLGEA